MTGPLWPPLSAPLGVAAGQAPRPLLGAAGLPFLQLHLVAGRLLLPTIWDDQRTQAVAGELQGLPKVGGLSGPLLVAGPLPAAGQTPPLVGVGHYVPRSQSEAARPPLALRVGGPQLLVLRGAGQKVRAS